jgi:hypothetical protein
MMKMMVTSSAAPAWAFAVHQAVAGLASLAPRPRRLLVLGSKPRLCRFDVVKNIAPDLRDRRTLTAPPPLMNGACGIGPTAHTIP